MLGCVSVYGAALLITGKEDFLGVRAMEARRDEALAEQPEAQVHQLTGSDLSDIPLPEILGGSLLSSHSISVIADIGSTPPEVVPQVIEAARKPPEEVCLILIHDGGVKGKKLLDGLKKAKVPTLTVKPLTVSNLPGFCQSEAQQLRCRLSRAAAEALIDALGTDLRTLAGAVRQLADDLDGKDIDADHVKRYFNGRADVSAFKIADAVLAGNAAAALEQLRWALHTGAGGPQVTAVLASQFRGLGKYLDLSRKRISKGELASQIEVSPWKLEQFARYARSWSRPAVAEAIRQIAVADQAVKGAAVDADYALERLVLDVLAAQRRSR